VQTDRLPASDLVPTGACNIAVKTALAAGAILRERLTLARTIDFKSEIDLVTDADRASEELIASNLLEAFPDHRFVGEERSFATGAAVGSSAQYSWIVDPLDGTTNYAHRYPHFGVSIALEFGGAVILGVVYDPIRDELFLAEIAKGATLNGASITVSTESQLMRALLGTGFAYAAGEREENARIWNGFLFSAQGVRRDGSAALNLCYVAVGRFDGFWERPLNAWDIAAGALIVTEAGGSVSAFGGGPFDPYAREIVASNGPLHSSLIESIDRHRLSGIGPSKPEE
jgi:myo-inositol-1(or 4)-monophosphatase